MRPANREEVDQRLIDNVVNQEGNLITNETDPQVGGYPRYETTKHTLDIPSNPNGDDDNDGYTNVEEWLHKKAAAISTGAVPAIHGFATSHRVAAHARAAATNLKRICIGHKAPLRNARTTYYSLRGSLISNPSIYLSGVLIEKNHSGASHMK
jgi:hypothetical protein